MEACVVLISGRVQGVGFRWFTERQARQRGVRGYVRNLPDGRVEVLAQAEREVMSAFLDVLRDGPGAARVDGVEVVPTPVDVSLTAFRVRI